jgi:hypothetical protein
MTRCVVNVATGHYRGGQDRLRAEMSRLSPGAAFMSWGDELPPSSPQQRDKPYAFKAWALQAARAAGHRVLLWADASVVPVRDVEPLWKQVEQKGYWVALNGWTNYEWTADSAYKDLFPNLTIEEGRRLNKQFPQVVATSFGLSLDHYLGREIMDRYLALAKTDAFVGPWANTNCPREKRFDYGPNSCYTMGPCGPPDVLGHRHDQTALSVIAWQLGLTLSQCPEVFSYPPGDGRTILMAVGA